MSHLTLEHAIQGGKASGIARRKLKAELAELREELAAVKADKVLVPVEPIEVYSSKRLSRVRTQIESLSDMLEAETNPQSIDRLASALARLNEIERQLANRPLPGSWKPQAPRPAARARAEPIALPQATISSVQPSAPSSDSPKS